MEQALSPYVMVMGERLDIIGPSAPQGLLLIGPQLSDASHPSPHKKHTRGFVADPTLIPR